VFEPLDKLIVGGIISISCSGGNSSNKIKYSVSNNSCYIQGNNLIGVNSGYSVLTATKEADFMYYEISESILVYISKIDQNIILHNINLTNEILAEPERDYDLVISGIKEYPEIKYNIIYSYSLGNFDICKIQNGKLSPLNQGVCIIEAITSETATFNSTKSNQIIVTVKQLKQSGLVIIPSGPLYFSSSTKLNITGGSTNGLITINASNDNCLVNGTEIIGNNTGYCMLTITKEGDEQFQTYTTDYFIRVNKIKQQLKLENINTTNTIFVYDNKIRCVDIKPNNFVLKFTDSKPIVKMIDIDDCFIFDDTIEETYRNMLLLMTLYQFYLFFDNKKYNFVQKDYIMSKIKEKTMFFNLDTKKQYENLFKIFDYCKHYEYLNYYFKNYNNENVKFDFIWNALNKSTDEIIPPPKKKQKKDGKRSRKGRHSKKRSRRK
jgi:hypothetical protein